MYFTESDLIEMARRDREDERQAQEAKRERDEWYDRQADRLADMRRTRIASARRAVGPCPCECSRGGFCGGCGHAGCAGRR